MKNPPVKARAVGWILGQEDALEKEMGTHSSILAWEILWTEEPGGLQFMGLQRVGSCLVMKQKQQPPTVTPPYSHTHTHTHTHTLMLITLFLIPSPHIIIHSCLLSLFPSCYFFSFYISGVQNLHSTGTWGNDDVSGNTPAKDSKVIISTWTFSK